MQLDATLYDKYERRYCFRTVYQTWDSSQQWGLMNRKKKDTTSKNLQKYCTKSQTKPKNSQTLLPKQFDMPTSVLQPKFSEKNIV